MLGLCVCDRGLVAGEGATVVAPREKLRGSPGSKLDPPLAKAEPISDGGCTSGITYLRRGTWEEGLEL